MAAGIWQVSVISWSPAALLMCLWALSPLDTQRLYRARKSAVAAAVVMLLQLAVMGSRPSHFEQSQPRRASWTRSRGYTVV
jgi:hypothetical protein